MTTTRERSRPAGPARPALPRLRSATAREAITSWVMLAPAIALLVWWFVVPIVQSVVLSFQQVSTFRFDERTFVGLQNYQQLAADPAFARSLGITATFVGLVVPAQTLLAILVAAALRGVRVGRTGFRTAFFVPYMTSTVAITTIFMQLFVKGGPLTSMLASLGMRDVTWYADSRLALLFLVVVYVYMFVGLYIVIFVGGM